MTAKIMKIKQIIFGLVLGSTMAFTGCEAEYQPDLNRVFINEAVISSVTKVKVDGVEDTYQNITIALATPSESDIKVRLVPDQAFVDQYNKENGTNLLLLPEFKDEECTIPQYTMESEIVIPAGKVSARVPVAIHPFATPNDEQYAFAMAVEVVEGTVTPTPSSSQIMVIMDKPLIQWVPYCEARTIPQTTDNWANFKSKDWSIEFLAWKDSFDINNQCVINVAVPGNEIYVRWGDVTQNGRYDFLQIKYNGSQIDVAGDNLWLTKNKWYHYALVYSQAAKTLTIYYDGKQVAQMTSDCSETEFAGFSVFSSGSEYFWGAGMMAQLRMWSRSLSAAEIEANMLSAVNPSADGLEGYWKMNEGWIDNLPSQYMFNCATKSLGTRDLKCQVNPTWKENVKFAL